MSKLSLKYTRSAKTLTSFSGLNIFSDLFHKYELQTVSSKILPLKKRKSGWKSSEKLFCGVMGFIAGAQCLDDFDWLGNDPLFREITDAPSSVTMEKFLRQFSPRQIEQLRNTLPPQAMRQRLWLEPKLHKIVFRMDATTHEQYANKMEGVEWNYKKIKCQLTNALRRQGVMPRLQSSRWRMRLMLFLKKLKNTWSLTQATRTWTCTITS